MAWAFFDVRSTVKRNELQELRYPIGQFLKKCLNIPVVRKHSAVNLEKIAINRKDLFWGAVMNQKPVILAKITRPSLPDIFPSIPQR